MPEFTQDFFTRSIPNFQVIQRHLGQADRVLEIGCYQGQSACWILQNLLAQDGCLVCVDTFTRQDIDCFGLDQVVSSNLHIADRFWRNIQEHRRPGQTVDLLTERSYTALARLIHQDQQFDFIYVDGNHSAAAIMADASMSWGLLRSGGIMLLDDYELNWETKHTMDHWLAAFGSMADVILHNDQIGLRRR